MDIVEQINAISREVGDGYIRAGESRTVLLRRRYDAEIEDVWSACTDPDRIARWFLPVTGDLRLGGNYQLEGNAGGEILRCDPPRLLTVTWVYGDEPAHRDVGEVEIRLSPGADGDTMFELEHARIVDPERWATYGPGDVGIGWDLVLLGLSLHLTGDSIEDPAAWQASAEAREFVVQSAEAWQGAHQAAGATAAEAAAANENTLAFYLPDGDGTDTRGDESASG